EDLLYLGRIVEVKGLDVLIKAMVYTDKKLVVYGEGGFQKKCAELCEELGLGDRVVFKGPCSHAEVNALMQQYKYFVLPGKKLSQRAQQVESWGFTVNEALANGCKVVVSDSVGAAPDLII